MKAAVLFEPNGKLSIEDVELESPKKDEVLVKIHSSGLCHTDWETMNGYQPVNLPAIIGHEGAGTIVETGEGVEKMISKLSDLLRAKLKVYELAIPLSRGDLIAQVHREAQVLIEDVQGDTLVMRARLDEYAQARLRNHIRGVTSETI